MHRSTESLNPTKTAVTSSFLACPVFRAVPLWNSLTRWALRRLGRIPEAGRSGQASRPTGLHHDLLLTGDSAATAMIMLKLMVVMMVIKLESTITTNDDGEIGGLSLLLSPSVACLYFFKSNMQDTFILAFDTI